MVDLKKALHSYHWEKWLQRNWFNGLYASIFVDGYSREAFEKIGVKGVELEALFFQDHYWYKDEKIFGALATQFEVFLQNHTVFDITRSLDSFYLEKRKRVLKLNKATGEDLIPAFKEVCGILSTITSFIWAAHGLETFYYKKLRAEVSKYVKGDVDLFIGDASFPSRKNAHSIFEQQILDGVDPELIAERFGWIKARDGVSDAFTVAEIKSIKKDLKSISDHKQVVIPKQLKPLFEQVQELVYFRTARTDVFYEFLFLSRPLFKKVADHYCLTFEELQFYDIHSLIAGKPVKHSESFALFSYKGKTVYSNEPLFVSKTLEKKDFVNGQIAQMGITKGVVKVIQSVSELGKVKPGDVLVTPMTFPSYISAMAIACAFVTDEGGITCHAAIVAREMKKPCVIGTKTATKVFKDGDLVEVDANKGIVKLLKKA